MNMQRVLPERLYSEYKINFLTSKKEYFIPQ